MDGKCVRNPIQSESESRIQNPNPIHVCDAHAGEPADDAESAELQSTAALTLRLKDGKE